MKGLFTARRIYSNDLGTKVIYEIDRSIDRTNWQRLIYFFGLTMAYEILLVAMVDLPALSIARSAKVFTGQGAPIGAGEDPA